MKNHKSDESEKLKMTLLREREAEQDVGQEIKIGIKELECPSWGWDYCLLCVLSSYSVVTMAKETQKVIS
jgi:serine protease inhibitor ecotin